jgi:PAS domain S-box-containing protein
MLVRQAIAPIINSILHLELQINNTILREAEQKARKNEARLANILETSNEGFMEVDFSGTVLNINQEVCRMLGTPKDEILNKNLKHFILSTSLPEILEQLENRRKGKKGKYETTVVSSTGEKVHCLISAAPIYENPDMSGEPSASFAMITDITRLKETEERLREFERIVSASNDMIALIGRNHVHKTVNRAYGNAFGLDDMNAGKISLDDVFLKMNCHDIMNQSLARCLDGENVHFRHWFDIKGHGNKYFDVAFYPYSEKDEKTSAAIIVMRDITEIRILETNLQQAQKMEAIGTLAGGIAHDFNNILSGILGYISLAQLFSENQTKDYLQKAQNSCQRAADLIKQILTFARKNDEDLKPFAITPTVKETLKLLRASVPTTIRISSDIEDSSRRITGNPTQIHQVLLNLCTNAVHAMENRGGDLRIRLKAYEWMDIPEKPAGLKKDCPYFILTVSDSGAGMSEDIMNRIFEPFFTTKEPGKGTGLGLSMSHGIVKSHGGEITVSSSPGCGTEFRVFFPVTCESSVVDKKDKQNAVIPAGKERILFVDDEDAIAEITILLLSNIGYDVSGFTDPSKALDTFREDPLGYDLLITDQTMPGMTGLELAANIRKIRSDMPVIICSGFSEQLTPEKIEQAGIDMFIIKPLTIMNLSESIRKTLDGRNYSDGRNFRECK